MHPAPDRIRVLQIPPPLVPSLTSARMHTILQVHDELVFDLHKDEADVVMPLVEEAMKNALPMSVPIVVEMGMGNNWLEAH